MIDIKAIKAAAEAIKGWGNCNQAWLATSDAESVAMVGAVCEEGVRYPVATIDCDQYYAGGDSLPLAKFYATANPATVIALCDEIERLTIIASELQDLCDRQAKRLAEVEKDAARLDHVLKWDDGYWTSRLQIDKCIADDADMENMK